MPATPEAESGRLKVQSQPGELHQWYGMGLAFIRPYAMARIIEKIKKKEHQRKGKDRANKYILMEENIKLIVFLISIITFFCFVVDKCIKNIIDSESIKPKQGSMASEWLTSNYTEVH